VARSDGIMPVSLGPGMCSEFWQKTHCAGVYPPHARAGPNAGDQFDSCAVRRAPSGAAQVGPCGKESDAQQYSAFWEIGQDPGATAAGRLPINQIRRTYSFVGPGDVTLQIAA